MVMGCPHLARLPGSKVPLRITAIQALQKHHFPGDKPAPMPKPVVVAVKSTTNPEVDIKDVRRVSPEELVLAFIFSAQSGVTLGEAWHATATPCLHLSAVFIL